MGTLVELTVQLEKSSCAYMRREFMFQSGVLVPNLCSRTECQRRPEEREHFWLECSGRISWRRWSLNRFCQRDRFLLLERRRPGV